MNKESLVKEVRDSQEFFSRSTAVLSESDSGFAPTAETMTVCQQVAHAAATIHWLIDGALSPEGFDLDFEKQASVIRSETSLTSAREKLNQAYERALSVLARMSEQDLLEEMAPGPVMGGQVRMIAMMGIVEHTAHHRGALTVYSRVLGKIPNMPYMDV